MLRNQDLAEQVGAAVALEGERIRSELQAGMAAFDRGNRIDGARYRPLSYLANRVAWAGSGRLVGWSLRAVDAAATITLYDGHDAANPEAVLATIGLDAAGASSTVWAGPGGIAFTEALYVDIDGAVVGAVWLGAVD